MRLGHVRHQPHQQPGQPHRLRPQLPARGRVALVEHEVDDAQHAAQPLRQQVVARHLERDPPLGHLVARPREPPLHRALGGHERARDLRHGQPGHAAQRQRHPRLGRQRGMAAREQHPQLVVVQRGLLEVDLVVVTVVHQLRGVRVDDALVAEPVERLAPRGRGQPRARPVRHAAAVPLDRRGHERVLDDVLRQCEVAVQPARDGRQHRAALVAEGPLERVALTPSRTPSSRGSGPRRTRWRASCASSAIAASRSSTSMIVEENRISLVSAYGPSVTFAARPHGRRGLGLQAGRRDQHALRACSSSMTRARSSSRRRTPACPPPGPRRHGSQREQVLHGHRPPSVLVSMRRRANPA